MKKLYKKNKNKTFIIFSILCLSIISIICILELSGVTNISIFSKKENIIVDSNYLKNINDKCILVEEKNITMNNETDGTATIIITIPDYTELYLNAIQSDNSEKYIREALESGNYNTLKYEKSAHVTVENGKTIVFYEEIVEQLLEKELIKAINALSEEG